MFQFELMSAREGLNAAEIKLNRNSYSYRSTPLRYELISKIIAYFDKSTSLYDVIDCGKFYCSGTEFHLKRKESKLEIGRRQQRL